MEKEKRSSAQERVAAWSALITGIIGAFGGLYLFLTSYKPLIAAEIAAGSPSEAIVVTYLFPMLTDFEVLAGLAFLVSAYGFARGEKWAWLTALVASVGGLLPSFFQMIPPMSRGLFPSQLVVFGPYLFMYVLLLLYVRPVPAKLFIISFFSGITYVLTFMNGVAGFNRIVETKATIFVATQQLNWISALGWAIFTVGVVLRRRWALPIGLGSGLLGTIAGSPLAILSTMSKGGFSMFYPAPVLSLLLFLILLVKWDQLYTCASADEASFGSGASL